VAKTIYRLLEVRPGTRAFKRNEGHLLETAVPVADEISMVGVPLMSHLLRALLAKPRKDMEQLRVPRWIGSGCDIGSRRFFRKLRAHATTSQSNRGLCRTSSLLGGPALFHAPQSQQSGGLLQGFLVCPQRARGHRPSALSLHDNQPVENLNP
jgi:hypothetical protein